MKTINDLTRRTLFIAEIGKNFIDKEEEEDVSAYLEKAKRLVDAAEAAGADVVKFQTHHYEDEQLDIRVESPHFKGSDRYAWVKRNTLSTPIEEFWKPLMRHCREKGVLFLSTPMSRGAARMLESIGVDFWKIGSGDILDFVMMDYVISTKKPIIVSTGMSTPKEVDAAVNFLKSLGADFALLHCVSKYPCPREDLNLLTINHLKRRYGAIVGLSNHSLDIESDIVAFSLGARIIERHFTFDREAWGSDHKASLLPDEFRDLVDKVREFEDHPERLAPYLSVIHHEEFYGEERKKMHEGEEVFRGYFRKALVAARDLEEGETIGKEDVYAMRPQAFCRGLPSESYLDVIGRRTTKAIKKYGPIEEVRD